MHSLRVCCTHVVRQLLVFKITWVSVHSTATLLGRPSMLLDELFPACIAKQLLCTVLRHFTETTSQKIKT